jgi:Fe2+ transport system protein FeoA
LKDNFTFIDAEPNTKYIIDTCLCEERFHVFGIRPGEEITIKGECFLGGTIIVRHKDSEFCVRRNEIQGILKKVK